MVRALLAVVAELPRRCVRRGCSRREAAWACDHKVPTHTLRGRIVQAFVLKVHALLREGDGVDHVEEEHVARRCVREAYVEHAGGLVVLHECRELSHVGAVFGGVLEVDVARHVRHAVEFLLVVVVGADKVGRPSVDLAAHVVEVHLGAVAAEVLAQVCRPALSQELLWDVAHHEVHDGARETLVDL